MEQLFKQIPPNLYPIITDYAKILIPAIITYLITRYSLSRPRIYAIKEKQFELVYLPLYLLTRQYISTTSKNASQNMRIYIKRVDKIIYKNYPYVYPKTLKLFNLLKSETTKQNPNFYFVSNFEYQVNADYARLKGELGYPTSSFIEFFKQLNFLDKFLFFIYVMLLILGIFAISNFFLQLLNGKLFDSIVSLFCSAICIFLLYVFRTITKH